jgi:hypothetical protein
MAQVTFTRGLHHDLPAPPPAAEGSTVREVLDQVFRLTPPLRDRVVDEEGRLRKQILVFIDGVTIADRERLSDPVEPGSSVFVMQALSGGASRGGAPPREEHS